MLLDGDSGKAPQSHVGDDDEIRMTMQKFPRPRAKIFGVNARNGKGGWAAAKVGLVVHD